MKFIAIDCKSYSETLLDCWTPLVHAGPSAKVELFPLYLMRDVSDRRPKDQTQLTVYLVHSA